MVMEAWYKLIFAPTTTLTDPMSDLLQGRPEELSNQLTRRNFSYHLIDLFGRLFVKRLYLFALTEMLADAYEISLRTHAVAMLTR